MATAKELEMPELTVKEFKASVYGHLHQLSEWPETEGFQMYREPPIGFKFIVEPYFIANFMPEQGKYRLTCPDGAEEKLEKVFENMFSCSDCLEKKNEILENHPDLFSGERPEELVNNND